MMIVQRDRSPRRSTDPRRRRSRSRSRSRSPRRLQSLNDAWDHAELEQRSHQYRQRPAQRHRCDEYTADTPTNQTHAIDHVQVPLPSHHAAETDALFTAMQMLLMLLSDISSALGTPELPPISLGARLTLLELLPTRLSKSELNHVWSLPLVLLEVLPSLLMLLLSDARQ